VPSYDRTSKPLIFLPSLNKSEPKSRWTSASAPNEHATTVEALAAALLGLSEVRVKLAALLLGKATTRDMSRRWAVISVADTINTDYCHRRFQPH
jgi:hypothetical protein